MLITIAIPAFNEEKLLPSTLAAVTKAGEAFSKRGWEMDMVVCDNNSTDSTAEIAKAAKARVVFEKHNQISLARNAAGNAAKGEWIIFIDADSKPSKELFEATAVAMDKKEIVGGGATVKFEVKQHWMFSLCLVVWNAVSRVMRLPAGSYIFCRAKDFRELNGFSEKFYAAEEIDFGRRLKKLGRKHRQRLQILTQTPLATSPRRFQFIAQSHYAATAGLEILLKGIFSMVFTGGRALHKPENCHMWYDGKR